MRKYLCVFLVLFFFVGNLIAEENSSYIKPTFSFGFAFTKISVYSEILTVLGLDVDFVTESGLTYGIQTIMLWNDKIGAELLIGFGLGYTYSASIFSAGGKVLAVPFAYGGIGFDFNATYWFNNNIGLTGIIGFYTSMGSIDWSLFSLRIGISSKL